MATPQPTTAHPLDNPARTSLLGPHARFAIRRGEVLRYPEDVSPLVALPDVPDAQTWRDAAELVGPGQVVPVAGLSTEPPDGWETAFIGAGVQMVGDDVVPQTDADAIRLGPADVPEMLALVGRTRPGPFLTRTIEMGSYLGIRHGGDLVAMAGERLHPPGFTEISAVCTDAAHRGRGLATRLVRAVAAGIRARGETPFLHAAADNVTAVRLYGSLGFRLRRETTFVGIVVPTDRPVG